MYEAKEKRGTVEQLLSEGKNYVPTIQVYDKVSLSIWNHDDLSVGSVYGIYNSNEVFGKWLLVMPDSTVILPKIGKVKLAGIAVHDAIALLTKLYSKEVSNPVVDLRIHNHQVTVLGQVIKPGNYVLVRGKNTISQLLGEAGGTDYYAKLQEVKLVRDSVSYELDLTELSTKTISAINLLPDDVIYVPTKKGKALDKKSPSLLAIASLVTTILLIISATSDK